MEKVKLLLTPKLSKINFLIKIIHNRRYLAVFHALPLKMTLMFSREMAALQSYNLSTGMSE